MTNADTYLGETAHKPSMLDRFSGVLSQKNLANGRAYMAEKAQRLRQPAMRAVSHVRSHPAPYLIGAGAVVLLAGLLMNRRSRQAGMRIAEQALSKVRH